MTPKSQPRCGTRGPVNKAAQHIGAAASMHRIGSSLNEYMRFHLCVVDFVFEAVPTLLESIHRVRRIPLN